MGLAKLRLLFIELVYCKACMWGFGVSLYRYLDALDRWRCPRRMVLELNGLVLLKRGQGWCGRRRATEKGKGEE